VEWYGYYPLTYFFAYWQEEYFEKMENAKVTGTGLLDAPKDMRER